MSAIYSTLTISIEISRYLLLRCCAGAPLLEVPASILRQENSFTYKCVINFTSMHPGIFWDSALK
jgi:hypothetical protein